MKFIEWIFEIPRRIWESREAMQHVVIAWLFLLAVSFFWYIVIGPQILSLVPLVVLLYTIYWLEEKSE